LIFSYGTLHALAVGVCITRETLMLKANIAKTKFAKAKAKPRPSVRAANRPRSGSARPASKRARRVTDQRLHDPSFDREALADALGISVRGLTRLFTSLQTSPSEYIRMRRLEQCRCALLASAGMTATEIALSNGFNDSSHFSSAFRKEFGMSPSEYRATHNEQSADQQAKLPALRLQHAKANWPNSDCLLTRFHKPLGRQ
jgi:AraC-like DNA-binding protein